MTNPTPNKFDFKAIKTIHILSAVMSLICIIGLTLFFFNIGRKKEMQASAEPVNSLPSAPTAVTVTIPDGQKEMRGAWIASVNNINFPSRQGLSVSELKAELDSILQNADSIGLNALFFQVRPCCDALYKSDIFPASKLVTGTQGVLPNNDFDCLEYLLQQSKQYNIDIHAWINPYRVSMSDEDISTLSASSPAALHPEYTVRYADGKTYLNPGLPEVRELVISGVRELVTNYPELSGIHYDDYFYPYPVGDAQFDDAQAFELYGNGALLEDWRRSNVNTLVKETYEAIKSIDPDCSFGVSPFGIWANSTSLTPTPGSATSGLEAYSALFCDALTWANGGYVDYLAPQNYWSFDTSAAPFDTVARWWNANLDGTGVDLYMGHAVYKAADFKPGEIAMQVEFCRSLLTYKGSLFYGFDYLLDDDGESKTRLSKLYSDELYFDDDITSTGQAPKINFPVKNSFISYANTYILGSSDPAYPLKVNGIAVSRTKDGYFSDYVKAAGQTQITMQQNEVDYVHPINVSSGKTSPYTYKTMDSFQIGATYPAAATWLNIGDTLTFGCEAPAGCVVTAKIGGMEIVLSPTVNPPLDGDSIMYEYYTGSVTPSTFANEAEIVSLGTLVFTATNGSDTVQKTIDTISQVGKDAYSYAEIKKDYTHTKVSTSSSFYDDFLPSSKGMRDYVKSFSNGYYKLRFGGYVSADDVTLNFGRQLNQNKLLTAAVRVNSTDFTNNDNNTTDIRLGITENVPVDVDFREGFMRLIIYNTDTSYIPEFDIQPNPLIESISGSPASKEGMLIYRVKLKNNDNFYGFNIVYENGMLIFKLNNPQKLSSVPDKPLAGKTIVVDAGHGGTDIGAPGPGTASESVLNYEIASRLTKKLRDLGAEVIETRGKDETLDLYARMDKLNEICPDLAVSVHHNSLDGNVNAAKTRGFWALYSNNSGVLLAKTVSSTLCRELNRLERDPSYQSLAVARNHRFPSALFEMSFISNVEEFQWTVSQGGFERSAQALTDGILDYYRAQEVYLEY